MCYHSFWFVLFVTSCFFVPQVALFQRGLTAMSKVPKASAATASSKQVKKSLVELLVTTKSRLGPYKKPSTFPPCLSLSLSLELS